MKIIFTVLYSTLGLIKVLRPDYDDCFHFLWFKFPIDRISILGWSIFSHNSFEIYQIVIHSVFIFFFLDFSSWNAAMSTLSFGLLFLRFFYSGISLGSFSRRTLCSKRPWLIWRSWVFLSESFCATFRTWFSFFLNSFTKRKIGD